MTMTLTNPPKDKRPHKGNGFIPYVDIIDGYMILDGEKVAEISGRGFASIKKGIKVRDVIFERYYPRYAGIRMPTWEILRGRKVVACAG